jgi:phosphoserine phosphatase RsbU/P
MAVLQIVQGPNAGHVIPLEKDSAILGRHPECDIVLDSGAVSRQHARISQADGGFYVEDLRSRNGTFLNGKPVLQRQLLQQHDRLSICDILFVFYQQLPSLAVPPDPNPVEIPEATALVVDDEPPTDKSTVMSKVDISSGSSSLQLAVNTEAKLRALIEIGQNMGKAVGLGEVLPKLLASLFTIFIQADRGFIVLRDPLTGRLVPKVVKHRREQANETVRISRTIVNGVMASKEAILSADATSDARFDMAESIVDFQIRSMMCAPLIASDGQVLGVIQIDTLDRRSRFSREDLDVLASVACQAAFAIENAQLHEAAIRGEAIKRELNVAHEVLRGFLPAAPPKIEQYDFFDFYEPANQLGGDYYDYIPLSEGRLAVVVADVSGKGIPASLLMAKLSADARYCLASEPTPAGAVARLNRVFCGSGWEDRFVTLVLAVLDPRRHEVTIVNAGHLPPLLRRGGKVQEAVSETETRLPLGVEHDVDYVQAVFPMAAGDCLTLYTDGITEAMDESDGMYGFERLYAQLASDAGGDGGVAAISRALLADVKRFVGRQPQSDDMCLVTFGRTVA